MYVICLTGNRLSINTLYQMLIGSKSMVPGLNSMYHYAFALMRQSNIKSTKVID